MKVLGNFIEDYILERINIIFIYSWYILVW